MQWTAYCILYFLDKFNREIRFDIKRKHQGLSQICHLVILY